LQCDIVSNCTPNYSQLRVSDMRFVHDLSHC